jgi:hypothetical protein
VSEARLNTGVAANVIQHLANDGSSRVFPWHPRAIDLEELIAEICSVQAGRASASMNQYFPHPMKCVHTCVTLAAKLANGRLLPSIG